jgi:hypothetical protein
MQREAVGHVGVVDCAASAWAARARACGTAPLENEYGSMHTSHDFFLLCASHVVRLGARLGRCGGAGTGMCGLPFLVDVADGAGALARMEEWLAGFCRGAAYPTGVCIYAISMLIREQTE